MRRLKQKRKAPVQLYRSLEAYLLIAGSAAGSVALAAIDRSVVLRDERHASRSATLRTGGLIHFALLSLTGSRAAVLAGDAAGLAAGRLILEALLRVELLLTSGEHKFLATVSAGQSLVLIHGIFPSEKIEIGMTLSADLVFDPTLAVWSVRSYAIWRPTTDPLRKPGRTYI